MLQSLRYSTRSLWIMCLSFLCSIYRSNDFLVGVMQRIWQDCKYISLKWCFADHLASLRHVHFQHWKSFFPSKLRTPREYFYVCLIRCVILAVVLSTCIVTLNSYLCYFFGCVHFLTLLFLLPFCNLVRWSWVIHYSAVHMAYFNLHKPVV